MFTCVAQLQAAIEEYTKHHNSDPRPLIWTASAQDILAKVVHTKTAQIAAARQAQDRARTTLRHANENRKSRICG